MISENIVLQQSVACLIRPAVNTSARTPTERSLTTQLLVRLCEHMTGQLELGAFETKERGHTGVQKVVVFFLFPPQQTLAFYSVHTHTHSMVAACAFYMLVFVFTKARNNVRAKEYDGFVDLRARECMSTSRP